MRKELPDTDVDWDELLAMLVIEIPVNDIDLGRAGLLEAVAATPVDVCPELHLFAQWAVRWTDSGRGLRTSVS